MVLEAGDVVFCEFKHTNGQDSDDRTVMVLAVVFAGDFIGCMITSHASNFESRIPLTNQDMQNGQLEVNPSYVRCHRMATLQPDTIRRRVGQAKPELVNQVMKKLRETFKDI